MDDGDLRGALHQSGQLAEEVLSDQHVVASGGVAHTDAGRTHWSTLPGKEETMVSTISSGW